MNNTSDKSMLTDCDHLTGKFFPMPDESAKGEELGAEGLTGGQSDKQKAARLNASDGYC